MRQPEAQAGLPAQPGRCSRSPQPLRMDAPPWSLIPPAGMTRQTCTYLCQEGQGLHAVHWGCRGGHHRWGGSGSICWERHWCFNRDGWGMCPFAQWLGRCDLTAGAGGHSLVRELRSRRLNSKKKKKTNSRWIGHHPSILCPQSLTWTWVHKSPPFTLITRASMCHIFFSSHVFSFSNWKPLLSTSSPSSSLLLFPSSFLQLQHPLGWCLSPWPLSCASLFSDLFILLQLSQPLSPSHTWLCQLPKSPSLASCRDRVLFHLLVYSWNAAMTASSSPCNSPP